MQAIYESVSNLDKRCYEQYFLGEEVLMEHAASGICKQIKKHLKPESSVLFVCGPGNNGADAIASARMLHGLYNVSIWLPYGAKSKMAQEQLKIARAIEINEVDDLHHCDCYVDGLLGSGFKGELDNTAQMIIERLNEKEGLKIACDIPSGIDLKGNIVHNAFMADITVTMGALKLALFSDFAKQYVGKIKVCDLGVQRSFYEKPTKNWFLEKQDMSLPFRVLPNVSKGTFGHLAVIAGEKQGAALLAANAAFAFGVGLVSIIGNIKNLPYHLMNNDTLPKNTTAIAAGMGLGKIYSKEELRKILIKSDYPIVIDADIFYLPIVEELFDLVKPVVLTPHPKEFCALLEIGGFGKIGVKEIQKRRFELAREFTKKFNVVLVLKGANTIIASSDEIYISTLGSQALSKGGNGDVLTGFIGSLLAQGYSALDAAITAVLAQGFALKKSKVNNYALLPQDIVENIKCL